MTAEITNRTRAQRGHNTIADYCARYGDDDDSTTVRDLLADLMHACGKLDFDYALGIAREHYFAEVAEEA